MTTFRSFRSRLYGLFFLLLAACPLSAQIIYAVAGPNLISFDAQSPQILLSSDSITGISPGQRVVGLDFRPNTGELYAMGYIQINGQTRLYRLDPTTAVASPVGAGPILLKPMMGAIGFDFNPTLDRIRITGSDKSNYRMDPETGTLIATDGILTYDVGDPHAGTVPAIGASAYSNSYIGATRTTLYNYDYALNIFTRQFPTNDGKLNTLGASGITVNDSLPMLDLDIAFDPASGVNTGYFSAETDSTPIDMLYKADLNSGLLTPVGAIGSVMPVSNIAVFIDRSIPASVSGDLLYALNSLHYLLSFDASQPDIIRTIAPVSGIDSGQVLSGLDFRPATTELYTLGYNVLNGACRLYKINTASGAATAVGPPVTLSAGLTQIGFDFDPVADQIRLTTGAGANLRLDPATGAIAGTDTNLAFAPGDVNAGAMPAGGAIAYDNSHLGDSITHLYYYDGALNSLIGQDPPNDGILNTLGQSGFVLNPAEPSADMDIYYDLNTQQNRAWLVANPDSALDDNLYSLDLNNGQATMVGKVGFGIELTELAAFLRSQVLVSCPADITVNAQAGMSSAVADFSLPVALSNCSAGGVVVDQLSGPASGSAFPAGNTAVCLRASDGCGNADSCCFKVSVVESACDEKTTACIHFEVLSIRQNINHDKVYRLRITNNCAETMTYAAFQLPNGVTARFPADNAAFTSDNGNPYTVRNPNFSPFYSIRFKSDNTGLSNGESDVFEYTLPKWTDVAYIHAFCRLSDGSGYETHLNTFECPVQPYMVASPLQAAFVAGPGDDAQSENSIRNDVAQTAVGDAYLYPNPSGGALNVQLQNAPDQTYHLSVYRLTGQLMQESTVSVATQDEILPIQLAPSAGDGMYLLKIEGPDGYRQVLHFAVLR